MSIKGAGFQRSSKASGEVPSSSLADIAFLLLIFFMVTTVFTKETERQIEWPAAEATQQIDEKRDDIMYVWLERTGEVFINDQQVLMDDVEAVVRPMWVASSNQLVISLRADAQVPYLYVDQLQTQLKRAEAVRVVFATDLERRMAMERR
jgi:biopolymer transport protein ExbD